MASPDKRAQALAQGAQPVGTVEEEFVKLLNNQPSLAEVVYANDIYENAYKSEVIEAFLLAEATPEAIFDTLKVPVAVVEVYKHLFFNRNAFQDELDVEAYAQTYSEDTPEQKYGKELKISALTLGLDYLIFRFSHKEVDVDLSGSLKSMIANAYMLTKAAKLNPLDSNASREARQWVATATKALEAYVRVKPATEKTDDEFSIALQNIERSTNEAQSGIKLDDIVH